TGATASSPAAQKQPAPTHSAPLRSESAASLAPALHLLPLLERQGEPVEPCPLIVRAAINRRRVAPSVWRSPLSPLRRKISRPPHRDRYRPSTVMQQRRVSPAWSMNAYLQSLDHRRRAPADPILQ